MRSLYKSRLSKRIFLPFVFTLEWLKKKKDVLSVLHKTTAVQSEPLDPQKHRSARTDDCALVVLAFMGVGPEPRPPPREKKNLFFYTINPLPRPARAGCSMYLPCHIISAHRLSHIISPRLSPGQIGLLYFIYKSILFNDKNWWQIFSYLQA